MALFQKLFINKKRHVSVDSKSNIQKSKPPKLDKNKIRLVIFSESDRGRTPYFDSNAIKPHEESIKQNGKPSKFSNPIRSSRDAETNSTCQKPTQRYHFRRLGNDVKVLEEMMFGTVAMAFKGSTLKIHLLRSPPQLMVSKVFIPEKPCRDPGFDSESYSGSLPGSTADLSSGEFSLTFKKPSREQLSRSIPVDVPSKDLMTDYSTDDDSGLASFTSSGSLRTSSYPSPSNNSLSSYSSLHRRWMRSQITSLDGHHRHDVSTERYVNRSRRNKLAIAIIFGSEDDKDEENLKQFQNFFFSHFALVEGHVEQLRSTIETVYFNTRNFLPTVMEALNLFRNGIYDLYMAPRLAEPVWLTMMSATTYKIKLCEKFMENFTWLATKFDNKNCKFFVSTLLSAVLTQHLAWVATVTPAGGIPAHTYQDKHSAKWIDALAKTHPYNPLWAQLGDLFGAIGVPRKISRTVVVGKKADIVKKLLYVLSYFIRCSEVHENTDPQCLAAIVNDPHLDVSLSPASSERTLIDSTSMRGRTPTLSAGSSGGSGGGVPIVKGDPHTINSLTNTVKGDSHTINSLVKQMNVFGSTSEQNLSADKNTSAINISKQSSNLSCAIKSSLENGKYLCSCLTKDVNSAGERVYPICDNCLRLRQSGSEDHSSLLRSRQYKDKAIVGDLESLLSDMSELDCTDAFLSTEHDQSVVSLGISELHNHIPNSLPCENVSFDKTFQHHQINGDSLIKSSTIHPNNPSDISTHDQYARSKSFSVSGRMKSRLTQQLENVPVKTANEVSRNKAAEIKLLLEGGSSSDTREAIRSTLSVSSISIDSGKKDTESNVLSRQLSHQGRPTALTRQQSVPSAAFDRRRHLSSTSSIDYEAFDPLIHCKEVKMPFALESCGQWRARAFDKNFGRSLLAGYSDHYLSDFVLHGTSDEDYRSRLLNDLQTTVKHSILDEPIDEAVCIIADTDNWTVEVASSKVMGISPSGCTTWTSSKLVADLIESVAEFSRLKMSPEFCLMHLEDRLQEIYFKSLMLSEYLTGATMYSQRELTAILGFETSDMTLLMAIACTHTPDLCQLLGS